MPSRNPFARRLLSMPKKTVTITLEQLELILYKALIDGGAENVAAIVQQIKTEVVQKSSSG